MTDSPSAFAKRTTLWVSLSKFVALVGGVVATIILRPPALYDQNLDAQYAPLMNVVGGVLLLFMMVLSKQAAHRVGSVWTSLIAVGLIVAAAVSLIAYLMVARTWSCTDGQGLRLVIGADYLPEAIRDMRDNGWTTCTEIIDNSAGALQTIWKDSEITSRFFTLFAWFIGNAVLFMTAIFLAIEAALLVLGKDLEAPGPAIGLALLFLAVMHPSPGRAQDQSWASLESEIRAQFAIAKARWQVREAEPKFPPTGPVRTFPKSDRDAPWVSLPQPAVRARLVGLDRSKQEIYLRWLVAHELWHRHQYERFKEVLPATLSVAQRECEADIMGTAFATESLLSTLSPDMSDASQQAMRDTLAEIRDAVDPAREAYIDPEYPPVDQRRLATQIGVNLALMKRLEGPARSGDRSAQALMAMTRKSAMMEGGDFDAWVSTTCGRIVHSGSGVANVRFRKPILDWHTTSDDPTVSFSIPVYAIGNGRVRGSFRAMTMLVRRADRDNPLYWRGLAFKDFNFELTESDGVQFLRGILTWKPDDSTGIEVRPGSEFMPSFLMPGAEGKDIGVLFDAERIWATTAAPPTSGPRAQLAAFLTSLSDAALQDFAFMPCDYGRSGPAIPVRIGQPGRTIVRCKILDLPPRFASGERVARAGRNGTHVTFDLARPSNAAAARSSLNQLLGDIKALYPGVTLKTQPVEGDRPTEFDRVVTITGVPYLSLGVSISNLAGGGELPEYSIALTADRD